MINEKKYIYINEYIYIYIKYIRSHFGSNQLFFVGLACVYASSVYALPVRSVEPCPSKNCKESENPSTVATE